MRGIDRLLALLSTWFLLLTGSGELKSQVVDAQLEHCVRVKRLYLESKGFMDFQSFLFPKPQSDGPRAKRIRTDGLFILLESCPVFERFREGFSRDTKHLAWSVSKSVTGLAVGRAEKLGYLNRNDLVQKFYSQLGSPNGDKLKIDHLLHWTSGFAWQETYEFAPLFSDVVAMLYTRGKDDRASYVLRQPWAAAPGERWNYSTGDSQALMGVLVRALSNHSGIYEFLETQFFGPLGIENWTWEADLAGTPSGGSHLYIDAKALANLGQLVLQDGRWSGEAFLPEDWITEMTKLSPYYSEKDFHRFFAGENGGGQWWVNRARSEDGVGKIYPDVSEDVILARGHWGQYLAIFPSKKLVVARFGDELDGAMDLNVMLHKAELSVGQEIPDTSEINNAN